MKVVPLSAIRRSEHAAVFRGGEHGAQVSLLVTTYRRGEGPEPHRHRYEETFTVLEGASVFTVEPLEEKVVIVGSDELLGWAPSLCERRLWAVEDCRHRARAAGREDTRQVGPDRRARDRAGRAREPNLCRPRPDEGVYREIKLLVDHP